MQNDNTELDLLAGVKSLPNVYLDKNDNNIKSLFEANTLEELLDKDFPKDDLLDYGMYYLHTVNENIRRNNVESLEALQLILMNKIPESKKSRKRRILI